MSIVSSFIWVVSQSRHSYTPLTGIVPLTYLPLWSLLFHVVFYWTANFDIQQRNEKDVKIEFRSMISRVITGADMNNL